GSSIILKNNSTIRIYKEISSWCVIHVVASVSTVCLCSEIQRRLSVAISEITVVSNGFFFKLSWKTSVKQFSIRKRIVLDASVIYSSVRAIAISNDSLRRISSVIIEVTVISIYDRPVNIGCPFCNVSEHSIKPKITCWILFYV